MHTPVAVSPGLSHNRPISSTLLFALLSRRVAILRRQLSTLIVNTLPVRLNWWGWVLLSFSHMTQQFHSSHSAQVLHL